MTEDYKRVVIAAIEPLFRSYPTYGEAPASLARRVSFYADALIEIPDDLLRQAAVKLIRTSPHLPKVDEIIGTAKALTPTPSNLDKLAALTIEFMLLRRQTWEQGVFDPHSWEDLVRRCEDMRLAETARAVKQTLAELRAEFQAVPVC